MISEPSAPCGNVPRCGQLLHFKQVIPERDWQLWILIDSGTALLANFQELVEAHGGNLSWEQWKAVRLPGGQQPLCWPCGLVCPFKELWWGKGEAAETGQRRIRVQQLPCSSMFYRPLMEHLPPETDNPIGFQLRWAVQESYSIEASSLGKLVDDYGTSADLLCRRLLDLAYAVQLALHTTLDDDRNWLHWQWHAAHRHATIQWPTPFAAIQAGYLHQVEAALGLHGCSGDQR